MAQPPVDEEAADRAREHVIAHLFDVELTRLAYARPHTREDELRADAALRELARRAAAGPARTPDRETEAPARPRIGLRRPRRDPAPSIPNRPRSRPARRTRVDAMPPGPRRALALTAAGGLLLSTVAALSATAAPAPEPPPSSLQLLYREASAAERDLRDRMLAAGLPVTIGPRILAAGTDADRGESLAAYRHVRAGTADDARNEVCVLLVDGETVGAPHCIDRGTFLAEGLQVALDGLQSRWSLHWGPTGEAEALMVPRGAEDRPSAPDEAPAPRPA